MRKGILKFTSVIIILLVCFLIIQTIFYFNLACSTTRVFLYFGSVVLLILGIYVMLKVKKKFSIILQKFNKVISFAYQKTYEKPISKPYCELDELSNALNEVITKLSHQHEEMFEQMQIKTKQYEFAKLDAESACLAKTQFLTNMSHEIRTPLNGITTVADLLVETNLDSEQTELVSILQASSQNLLELVNDIFDFSCIESGFSILEKNSFNLRDMLDNYLTQFSLKAHEKGIELILDINPKVPVNLVGDMVKLKRIIANLIGNAVKFTFKGEVCLKIEMVNKIEDTVMLKFVISDSGIGIEKDKLPSIFDSFTQGDATRTRQFGGTGLGTTIAKELCNIMKGEISAVSPNYLLKGTIYEQDPEIKGSIFTFTAEFDLQQKQEQELKFDKFDPEGKRILIVDDNAKAAHTLETQLVGFGFQVVAVSSAKHALQAIDIEKSKGFDAIFVDTFMPEENGFSLARKLMDINIDSEIIFISTLGGKSEQEQAAAIGLNNFLAKPVQQSKLFDMLQTVLYQHELNIHQAKEKTKKVTKQLTNLGNNILLVEDNTVNQWVAMQVFKRFGFVPDVAVNGKEAVEKHNEDNYNLIFMDIEMPIMDGIEATKKIRENDKDVKIIAMTANALKGDKEQCLQAGMNDYISKPISLNQLERKLKEYGNFGEELTVKETKKNDVVRKTFLKESVLDLVGDEDSLKEVLSAFVGFSDELLAELSIDIESDCHEKALNIRQKAHSLKGSAANLFMPKLKQLANLLEQAAKKQECENYKNLYNKIKQEYKAVRKEIAPYLEEA